MRWKAGLRLWREKRNLKEPQTEAIVGMLREEIGELYDAIINKDEFEEINACADLIVLASNHIEQKGYDLDLIMKETVKEISSREGSIGEDGKWHKDKNQNPDTLYKPDYSTCKIGMGK